MTIRSPTSITAQIRIDPSAPPGQRTIVIQNSDEKVTLNNGFTVASVNAHDANAPTPSIVIPASLDFGSVRVGLSLTKSIPIQNTGSTALQIQNIKTSPFTSSLSNLTIQPGTTANLDVTFTPDTATSFTGTLTAATTDPANPTTRVALTGTGTSLAFNDPVILSRNRGTDFPVGTNPHRRC